MLKIIAITVISLIFCCDNPTEIEHNYYEDLSKGTIDCMSLNEKQILNVIVANRMGNDSGIVLIIDSTTINIKVDSTRMLSSDTFPLALQQKHNNLNSKKHYIGDINLGNSFDYRYFDRIHSESTFTGDSRRTGWENYHSRYPKSENGIFSFSKIAINNDSTQALIAVQWSYGYMGPDGGFISLKKINGNWTMLVYIITLIS